MKIASWNVRGLNSARTQTTVARLIKKHRIDILGIQETKIEELEDLHQILLNKVPGWRAAHNFDVILGGRMVVCWNPQKIDVQIVQRTDQLVHCSMKCRITQVKMLLSFVYGLYTVVNRRTLWADLDMIGTTFIGPWLCLGDYNAYLKSSDKSGGPPITNYMVKDFDKCCTQNGLVDLNSTGFFYTWWNKHIWCKLDRALVNQLWLGAPFTSSAEFISFGTESDHTSCIVTVSEPGETSKRPFRYFNMGSAHPEYQNIVSESWTEEIGGTR